MSSIVLSGDTSGTVTVSVPAVAGTNTITLPAATGTVMVSGNMPAFYAYNSAGQSVSPSTNTKAQLNTKSSTNNATAFDTHGYFDNVTNFRYTPLIAGYYQFNAGVFGTGTSTTNVQTFIFKNGSSQAAYGLCAVQAGQNATPNCSCVIYMNGTTDYVELWGQVGGGSSCSFNGGFGGTYLSGAMIRTA
jgi:hypothetical protein